jgi:hypothetical protein
VEEVRAFAHLTRAGDSGEARAAARGDALKTGVGELFHHVELRAEVADIFDVFIGYFLDQA